MEPADEDQLWGAVTALNHLLEHTWAFLLFSADDPVAAVRKIRDRTMREFDLPNWHGKGDAGFRASQHAISILEDFWDRVEYRASPDEKP